MVFRAQKSIGREIRRRCRGTCISGGVLSLGMAWRRDEQSPLSWALLICPCCSWARSSPVVILPLLSSLLCLVPASLDLFGPLDLQLSWALWMCLGSWQATDLTWGWVITCLLSHAQEVGHKKAPDINFPLHRGGIAKWWVGLCPHLSLFLPPPLFIFLYSSNTTAHCSLLHPLSTISSIIYQPPSPLHITASPLSPFCPLLPLFFLCVSFASQNFYDFSCCA